LLIEPFFDIYKMHLNICRLKPIVLTLRPPTKDFHAADAWTLDMDELERTITDRTKLLLLNTPHNPTGKVFSRAELLQIADICKRKDIVVLSDEVYEELVFDGCRHERISLLPGMWDRTLTVCSAGKLFGATGWRIGWIYGAEEAIRKCVKTQTMTVFTSNTPFQVNILPLSWVIITLFSRLRLLIA
jgi:aspartate/methionine/tyrosine aminotransferase